MAGLAHVKDQGLPAEVVAVKPYKCIRALSQFKASISSLR